MEEEKKLPEWTWHTGGNAGGYITVNQADLTITVDGANTPVMTGPMDVDPVAPTIFVVKHDNGTYMFEGDSVILYDGRVTRDPDVPEPVMEKYRQAMLKVELGNDNSIVHSGVYR